MEKTGGSAKKRGSLTVEAAILLPLFLLAILTIGYLIRMTATGEGVFHVLADQSGAVAAAACLGGLDPEGEGPELPGEFSAAGMVRRTAVIAELKERIEAETRGRAESVRVSEYQYLYEEGSLDGQIRIGVSYRVSIPFDLGRYDSLSFTDVLQTRGFIGAAAKSPAGDPAELEKESFAHPVYVFPKYGERYHEPGCSRVASCSEERFLTRSLRSQYEACKVCSPASLPEGSRVYCFPETGEVFHRGSCPSVERHVCEMDRAEALKKGYSACQLCRGE
ncbi:MAG: hypothetical protein Q4C22_07460 [Bacillota bacterium]|nr:hypothetical protein [Bacillota bacterium]